MTAARFAADGDSKQRVRIRRFVMAFGTYLSAIAMMGVYVWQGFMAPERYLTVVAAILLLNAGLYLLLLSGVNRRLSDPSLTSVQIMVANVLLMLVLYSVDRGRGALLLLYLAAFAFGIFRLTVWQFLVLEAMGVVGYAVVIALLLTFRPAHVDLRLELVQLVALTLVLPSFALVGGYFSRLRQRLRASNTELQNALERIRELAQYDEVTGLHNRRYVLEQLEYERERAERTATPVTVALLDLDHFKSVNDRYGHSAGDRVLRRLGEVLIGTLRRMDAVGRYGGEEFLVCMPGTALSEGEVVAERLRRQVAETDFEDIVPGLRLTVSIGLSELQRREQIEAVIDRADRALYEAKGAGRNRVVRAQGHAE